MSYSAAPTTTPTGAIAVGAIYTARHAEVAALEEQMAAPQKSGHKRAWQLLPRHLRRRAGSHNPYRIPRRLRPLAINQMLQSARQPDDDMTDESDAALLERLMNMPPNRNSRPPRPMRRTLRKVNLSRSVTHIWHAKRFQMVHWGDRCVAWSCTNKSSRSLYRAPRRGQILLHDSSYYCQVRLHAENTALLIEWLQQALEFQRVAEWIQRVPLPTEQLLPVPVWRAGTRQPLCTVLLQLISSQDAILWVSYPPSAPHLRRQCESSRDILVQKYLSAFESHSRGVELLSLGHSSPRFLRLDLLGEMDNILSALKKSGLTRANFMSEQILHCAPRASFWAPLPLWRGAEHGIVLHRSVESSVSPDFSRYRNGITLLMPISDVGTPTFSARAAWQQLVQTSGVRVIGLRDIFDSRFELGLRPYWLDCWPTAPNCVQEETMQSDALRLRWQRKPPSKRAPLHLLSFLDGCADGFVLDWTRLVNSAGSSSPVEAKGPVPSSYYGTAEKTNSDNNSGVLVACWISPVHSASSSRSVLDRGARIYLGDCMVGLVQHGAISFRWGGTAAALAWLREDSISAGTLTARNVNTPPSLRITVNVTVA